MSNRIIRKEDIIKYTGPIVYEFDSVGLIKALEQLESEWRGALSPRRSKSMCFRFNLCDFANHQVNEERHYIAKGLSRCAWNNTKLELQGSSTLGINQYIDINETTLFRYALVVKIGKEHKSIMLKDYIKATRSGVIRYDGNMPEYGLFGKLTLKFPDDTYHGYLNRPGLLYIRDLSSRIEFIDGFNSYNHHNFTIDELIKCTDFSFEVLYEPDENEEGI